LDSESTVAVAVAVAVVAALAFEFEEVAEGEAESAAPEVVVVEKTLAEAGTEVVFDFEVEIVEVDKGVDIVGIETELGDGIAIALVRAEVRIVRFAIEVVPTVEVGVEVEAMAEAVGVEIGAVAEIKSETIESDELGEFEWTAEVVPPWVVASAAWN